MLTIQNELNIVHLSFEFAQTISTAVFQLIKNMLTRCRAVALFLLRSVENETMINVVMGRGHISWGKQQGHSPQRNHPPKPKDKYDFMRRARRVHSTLRKIESDIFPRPQFFVSLIFPPKFHFKRLTSKTPEETKKCRLRLCKSFKDYFPNGYMLWSIEYIQGRGVHIHLACTTGENLKRDELLEWFTSHWQRICEFEEENSVDVREYDYGVKDGIHGCYMTKPSKLTHKALLIECFDHMKTFGRTGRKNMLTRKPKKYCLYQQELEHIRKVLLRHLKKMRDKILSGDYSQKTKDIKVRKIKRQFHKVKSNFCLHYFDVNEDLYEVVQEEIHKICQKRKGARLS